MNEEAFPAQYRQDILETVQKALRCGMKDMGHIRYECLGCPSDSKPVHARPWCVGKKYFVPKIYVSLLTKVKIRIDHVNNLIGFKMNITTFYIGMPRFIGGKALFISKYP
ncbi:hypothetical protein [Solibacillus cecembensis]|uniref:hypothetical protein n=1 Tax=Solibacillus cecembensis TaxID=459347 RepID=UPI003D0956D2